MRILLKIINNVTIILLLSGCAGIPGNNVKLTDYHDVEVKDLKKLNLYYDYDENHAGLRSDLYSDYYYYLQAKKGSHDKYNDYLFVRYGNEGKSYENLKKSDKIENVFNYNLVLKLKSKSSLITKSNKKNPEGCVVRISSNKYNRFCPITNFISPYTLAIFPYYCQTIYEARATLIATKENKTLKEYYFKDKVHEVWSSLMFLAAVPVKSLRKLPSANAGKMIVEDNLSEALTRQVLNDALKFKECQK